MAQKATIYRATLDVSHVDRGVYGEHALTVARHPSETMERTVMRMLAYVLRCDEGLEFGRGVSAADEPDLWRREGDGRVLEWIEVGQPDAKRLIKAARQSQECRLFVFGDGASRYRSAQLDGMKVPENLSVAHLDDAFVRAVAATCDRQIRWSVTVSDGMIFLDANGEHFETAPEIWIGAPLA
jgi:uncharacterized protein YaeQ